MPGLLVYPDLLAPEKNTVYVAVPCPFGTDNPYEALPLAFVVTFELKPVNGFVTLTVAP